ncbi:hypothetical protein RhiJN_23517 [Ceratobasidium sp. AG-Ba]|nr:hypothetical protein RhiJN_23517 [Ceratobasidium sp. AG-Ba]
MGSDSAKHFPPSYVPGNAPLPKTAYPSALFTLYEIDSPKQASVKRDPEAEETIYASVFTLYAGSFRTTGPTPQTFIVKDLLHTPVTLKQYARLSMDYEISALNLYKQDTYPKSGNEPPSSCDGLQSITDLRSLGVQPTKRDVDNCQVTISVALLVVKRNDAPRLSKLICISDTESNHTSVAKVVDSPLRPWRMSNVTHIDVTGRRDSETTGSRVVGFLGRSNVIPPKNKHGPALETILS